MALAGTVAPADRAVSCRWRKGCARLFGVETRLSRPSARERRSEVCVSSRRLCARRKAPASSAWPFYECGLVAESVRRLRGTTVGRERANDRTGANAEGNCRANQNETEFGRQRLARCNRIGAARLGGWCQ